MGRLLTDVFALGSETPSDPFSDHCSTSSGFSAGKKTPSSRSSAQRSSVSSAYTPNRYTTAMRVSDWYNARRGSYQFTDDADLDLLPYQNYLVSSTISSDDGSQDEGEEEIEEYHPSAKRRLSDLTIYRCPDCQTDICHSSSVISTDFWGSHGKAYLVSSVLNVHLDSMDTRQMRTGNYGVKTIHCIQCNRNLGWKYCVSESSREHYKIGKYVIEKNIMTEFPI